MKSKREEQYELELEEKSVHFIKHIKNDGYCECLADCARQDRSEEVIAGYGARYLFLSPWTPLEVYRNPRAFPTLTYLTPLCIMRNIQRLVGKDREKLWKLNLVMDGDYWKDEYIKLLDRYSIG